MVRYIPHAVAIMVSVLAVIFWVMGVAIGPAYVAFGFVTTVTSIVVWISALTQPFVPEPATTAAEQSELEVAAVVVVVEEERRVA